jgi:hypothetical protein
MSSNDLFDVRVPIPYADTARLNQIRGLARRLGAVVKVSRYAKDAYEGHVSIPYRLDRSRNDDLAIASQFKSLIGG